VRCHTPTVIILIRLVVELIHARRKRRKIISDEEKSVEDDNAEDNERDEDDHDIELADVPVQSEYYQYDRAN